MKRIVHVTTVHPRDDIRIFRKECVSLARAGYEVVQVVGDGQGDATIDGVRIVDIGVRPASRLVRMRMQPARALATVRELKPALVHVHDPELLPLAAAMQRDGIPAIYDAHEDVPRQILTKQWIRPWMRGAVSRGFEAYENARVRRLAAVVAATPHIAQRFAAVARRCVVVANYPFPEELAPPAVPLRRERAVCYVGGITRTRGALEMVRAIAKLPGVRLLLAGRIEDAVLEAALATEPGWAQVDHLGHVSRDEVRRVMARASAGLVTLLPMPSYLDAQPIKMFEYMSAGLPVIASDFPLWRNIVERHGCGRCVVPTDVDAIATAIREIVDTPALVRAMGEAGQAAVQANYRWSSAEVELLSIYRDLLE